MTPFKWNYSVLRAGMQFVSHNDKLIGRIINLGVNLFQRKVTVDSATHAGGLTAMDVQILAAEVQGRGFKSDSLEKYCGKREQIIDIFDPIVPDAERAALVARIAKDLREDYNEPYDIGGAVGSSPFMHKLFPWLKERPKKQFCSEKCYVQCRESCPSLVFPLEWVKNPPNPEVFRQWMIDHPSQWRRLEGWKL